ncbi:pyrimidine reductase family protein [Smaragdicoccus niigatensis]|uniref:pyrimidine reductase family protein n=1 Tax=Smaragdicoccus niigatensis TaxID=359359 RepID=UPI00037507CA|nr:pyrimidine reductase family protein [Smaragdicoccus niigatensis]
MRTISELTDDDLRDLYAYPELPAVPWVRANFITTLDGAASVDDSSTGLGIDSDRRVFALLRDLSDVILVGAQTVRVEDYGGARTSERKRERREEDGLSPVPPIAVVTSRCDLDPSSRLFTDTSVPPLILTTHEAPFENRARLVAAGAQVMEITEQTITPEHILTTLAALNLTRVLCEGGPFLFGQLIADDLVDDLCLTIRPLLATGNAPRIAHSEQPSLHHMGCASIITDDDGTLLTRWIRTESAGAAGIDSTASGTL